MNNDMPLKWDTTTADTWVNDRAKLIHPEIERNCYNGFVIGFIKLYVGKDSWVMAVALPESLLVLLISKTQRSAAIGINFNDRIDGGLRKVVPPIKI